MLVAAAGERIVEESDFTHSGGGSWIVLDEGCWLSVAAGGDESVCTFAGFVLSYRQLLGMDF